MGGEVRQGGGIEGFGREEGKRRRKKIERKRKRKK